MTGRILLGALPSGAKGLRISQSGYDAATHPVDNEKMIFSSEWPETVPIYQVGSFVHRTTAQQGSVVTQTINYTTLGYIPFVEFYAQSNGDALPSGSDLFTVGQYFERRGMGNPGQLLYWGPLFSGDSIGYLRLNISSSQIRAESFVRNLSGNASQGICRTWTVYYVIYRKQAF